MNCFARWPACSIARCRRRSPPWTPACCENSICMASFFENQQLARRNTTLLVLVYFLAVAGVIIAVDLVLVSGWLYGFAELQPPQGRAPGLFTLLGAVP